MDEKGGFGLSEELDYSVRIPLAEMSLTDQERFWVVEGRVVVEGAGRQEAYQVFLMDSCSSNLAQIMGIAPTQSSSSFSFSYR